MHKGWICSWRYELEGDIWKMDPLYHRIWLYLNLKANWTTKSIPTRNIMRMYISPGMLVTSYEEIAEGVAYYSRGILRKPNKKTIMEILKWLEGNGMIRRESNSLGTTIMIVNWDIYQIKEKIADENMDKVTHSEPHHAPLSKRDVHTKNNDNNCNPGNNSNNNEKKGKGRREGSFLNEPSHPLSFRTYCGINDVEEETASAITFFIESYAYYRMESHPNLRHEQWQEIVDTFMIVDGDTVPLESQMAMISKYFQTDFENCDYRIFHYNTEGVKICRMYEEAY